MDLRKLQPSVKTGLPNLDYNKLAKTTAIQHLQNLKIGIKMPGGKYNTLLTYLRDMVKNKVGRDVDINPADVDKRIRNYFEDIITEILKNPSGWEKEMKFSGVALFNYLVEPYVREEGL